MTTFSIDAFAEGCKRAMADADDRCAAAKAYLETTMQDCDTSQIIDALEAAIPDGADIGEMLVHVSPELTMLYARIPPRFQSAIHNHTVFACIGLLDGEEIDTGYQRTPEGGVSEVGAVTSKVGDVISMPDEAIHRIENPLNETGRSLHIYGGDFHAVMGQRSLWTSDGKTEMPFDFKALLAESVALMKQNDNKAGLDALAKTIPAAAAMIESG